MPRVRLRRPGPLAGLHHLLMPRVRHHGERDCGDGASSTLWRWRRRTAASPTIGAGTSRPRDNLTTADPTVNRSAKSDRDAAEWMPARHGAWFAERVIQVKLEYGLSVDPAERDALEALLAGGEAQLNCVDGTPVPALPLIGQLLLGVGLLGGGARQLYRWTSG